MQELLEGGQVKDLIADGLAAIDSVLVTRKVRITLISIAELRMEERTFLVTLTLVTLPFWPRAYMIQRK